MNYKAIVIDDEAPARDLVKYFLKNHLNISIVGECDNGLSAVNAINSLSPDLIFLDIQIPDVNGFDVLRYLDTPKPPVVIFITAYDTYALQAFNAHAIDYLLKPYSLERFNQAINKALHFLQNKDNQPFEALFQRLQTTYDALRSNDPKTPAYLQRLVIKEKKRLLILKTEHITHINAADDYLEIHTTDGKKYLHQERLSKIEQQLDPSVFIRIHRSHIVNAESILALRPHFNGEYFVDLKNNTTLKLSRSYKDNLDRFFNMQM